MYYKLLNIDFNEDEIYIDVVCFKIGSSGKLIFNEGDI